jgi:antitoxin VapB
MTLREEWELKVSRVREWLRKAGAGAVLLGGQESFAWMTCGGDSHVSLAQREGAASVLVTEKSAHLLAANNELARILDEETALLPLDPVSWPWHQQARAREAVDRLVAHGPVVTDLGQLGLPKADGTLAALRFTLTPSELERYRTLGRDAADAVESACEEARPGGREREIAARVARGCVARGILPLVLLVAGDERISRYRHPLPTDQAWEQTLLVALTGRRKGLHASLSRMVCAGTPAQELLRRLVAVQRVDAAMLLASRPGASLGQVLEAGRTQYSAEGFPHEWELHHQGGLTGYSGRELFAVPGEPWMLGADQAVAWNPSITQVKSEDTAVVREGGVEVLTTTGRWPRDPVRIEAGTIDRPALLRRP